MRAGGLFRIVFYERRLSDWTDLVARAILLAKLSEKTMAAVNIVKEGRLARVTFEREGTANALSLSLMRELTEAARSFENDSETSAIVLSGSEDNFCLGFDLQDDEFASLSTATLAERRTAFEVGSRMCQAWEDIQALTISAINGWCVGGGVALAVSTDLRVMAKNSHLYVPEIERGLNMSWGSVPRITNLVGPARAKRIIVLAEKIDAARAVDWGMADEIAPQGQVIETALGLAERAASMPPVALRMCKQGINAYANALARTASWFDHDQFTLAQQSQDAAEGINAFFERRAPDFKGN